MVAIVTDPLKQLVADLLKINDSDASNNYYAAIGRSEQWRYTTNSTKKFIRRNKV